jgi:hypothetical protein
MAKPEEPGYISQAFDVLGKVAGASKAGIDYLARKGAGAMGIPVDQNETAGGMLRSAVGLAPGAEAEFIGLPGMGLPENALSESPYARRLLGKTVEFAGDTGTDPLAYATMGESALAKLAGAAFTGLMVHGAVQEGSQALDTYQREGFTPEVAEQGLGTVLGAAGAGLAGAHLLRGGHGPADTTGIAPEPFAAEEALRAAARERFNRRKAVQEAQAPNPGLPDVMAKSDLDQALTGADDQIKFDQARQEVRSDLEAFQNAQQVAALRNFRQNQGLAPALRESMSAPPGEPRLGARQPMLSDLEGGDRVRMSPRAAEMAQEMGVSASPGMAGSGVGPTTGRQAMAAREPRRVDVAEVLPPPGPEVGIGGATNHPPTNIHDLDRFDAEMRGKWGLDNWNNLPPPAAKSSEATYREWRDDTDKYRQMINAANAWSDNPPIDISAQPLTAIPSPGPHIQEIDALQIAAERKTELLPEPQARMVHGIADRALSDPAAAELMGQRLGMPPEAIVKGAEDIKLDGDREFSPEAVAIKKATLEALQATPETVSPETTQPIPDLDKTVPFSAAPEPVQVGAIPQEPQPSVPSSLPSAKNLTGQSLTPEAAEGQKVSQLPIPGKTKLPTVQTPEPTGPKISPNLGVSERSASLIADQAKMIQAAGIQDFPLIRREARKVIFDGDKALASLKARGRRANDLGSAAAEGVGALKDIATYGASLIEQGIRDFPTWSREMSVKLGDTFKDLQEHLKVIYDQALALHKKAKPEIKPIQDVQNTAPSAETGQPIKADTFTDEHYAEKIAKGEKFTPEERDALDERVVRSLDAKDAASTKLAEARASGGDIGTANAEFLDAALDYAASMGLLTKNELAAKRAIAAKAKLKDHGPQTPDKFIKQVFKQIPGVTNHQAATLLDVFQNRPEQLGDGLRAAMTPGAWRKFTEFWKAGLLTAPPTHIANITGNLLEQGARAVETAVAAGLDLAKPAAQRERFIGEIGAELAGAGKGFAPAAKNLLNDLRGIAKLGPEKIDTGGKLDHAVGAIGGKAGRAVRTTFRLLEAADGFFKAMFGEAELYKLAYRKAGRELKGSGNISARAAEIIKEAKGDSGQHLDLIEAVAQSKLNRTFQQEPGALTRSANQLVTNVPILEVVLPFRKTVGNITRATIGRSPAGFVEAAKKAYDYRQGKATRGEVLDSFARPLVGTAIMAGFGTLASKGLMTGGGPADQRQQRMLKDTGWQPYSFVFPQKDGSKVYVPYSRFQPISNLLGVAADMVEAKNSPDKQNLFEKGLATIKDNLLDDSYLKGLTSAIEAISDSDRFLPSYVAGLAGSLVPNIVARGAQAVDSTMRDTSPEAKGLAGTPERIAKTIQSRIPGLSQSLPARKTSTGEDVQRPGSALSRFASPVQPSTQKPGQDLEQLMVSLDMSRAAPSREATIPHGKGARIRLEEDEYKALTEADRVATEELRRRTQSSAFRRMDEDEQKKYIDGYYEKARASAKKKLWADRDLRRRASEQIRTAGR